jgi:hypothetical protein
MIVRALLIEAFQLAKAPGDRIVSVPPLSGPQDCHCVVNGLALSVFAPLRTDV